MKQQWQGAWQGVWQGRDRGRGRGCGRERGRGCGRGLNRERLTGRKRSLWGREREEERDKGDAWGGGRRRGCSREEDGSGCSITKQPNNDNNKTRQEKGKINNQRTQEMRNNKTQGKGRHIINEMRDVNK